MGRMGEISGHQAAGRATPKTVARAHPDLVLAVRHEERDRHVLSFRLEVQNQTLGLVHDEAPPHTLPGEALTGIESLFKTLGEWSPQDEASRRKSQRRLAAMGGDLFRDLIPAALGKRLARLAATAPEALGSVPALQIVSNEFFIPWELLKLPTPNGRGRFLAECFSLTRWLSGHVQVLEFPLRDVGLVVARDCGLPGASDERAFIQSMAGDGCRVTELPARSTPIVERLAAGDFDALHFTGHGFAQGDNPNLWSLQLDMGDELTAYDLKDGAHRLGGRSPLIFANACHSSRSRAGFSCTGGLAQAFLEAGAGAYMGTHWAVDSGLALDFSKAFYPAFLKERLPLGEAVRRARIQARELHPGDPSWLAYTVFAHPFAYAIEPDRAQADDEKTAEGPEETQVDDETVTLEPSSATTKTPAIVSVATSCPPRPSEDGTDRGKKNSSKDRRKRSLEVSPSETWRHDPNENVANSDSFRQAPISAGKEQVNEKDGTVLVYVPGAEFTLGGLDANEWSKPVYQVTLSGFWIGKFPITNQQFARFLEETGRQHTPAFWQDPSFNDPRQPVVGVSWADAMAYCRWAGLDLPSEAQWEAAARGVDGYRFPWGNAPPTNIRANFGSRLKRTSPVDAHPAGAGPYGTLDQAGNVWEWCLDAWSFSANKERDFKEDPVIRGDPALRVVRGGSWINPAKDLLASYRDRATAGMRVKIQGFRAVST